MLALFSQHSAYVAAFASHKPNIISKHVLSNQL